MAAISLIEVDTIRLNKDIQKLRITLNQTRTHIQTLQTKMDAMNNMWDGPANMVFRQRFTSDHAQMLDLCDSLEELIQTLETIRQSYDVCENSVRSAVDALRI